MLLVYCPGIDTKNIISLSNDEAHHLTRVLRKLEGDEIFICDGSGNLFLGTIVSSSKKQTDIRATSLVKTLKEPESKLSIAIAPTKNISRFEWFVEKATEIGVAEIIPITTKHSERDRIKLPRIEKIIISAMKQSGHLFKPTLHPLTTFNDIIQMKSQARFIAYSETLPPKHFINLVDTTKHSLILIGPEGDFSASEYTNAIDAGFYPVQLGNSRLRTETAGVTAAQIFENKKYNNCN
ncbi:MAG: RsmE family RNA methyltransferase [Bacteroidota bacterium]|nr:RsmE family RNA methyltransferase [Bacteroidota bacterium]